MDELEFSNNLRRIMNDKKMTGEQVAEKMGTSPSTIIHWANGRRFPKNEELIKKLANILNVHIGELFGEEIAVKTVPLIGVASCGVPNIAYPDAIENISVPEMYARDGAYAVIADGESMLPKIKHGDIILCDRNMEVNNGDIVHYTTIDGESGLKKYNEKDGMVTLYPLNTDGYAPIVIDKNDVRFAKAFMIMSSL
jgi:SOS-response transcriptional repressor LexA